MLRLFNILLFPIWARPALQPIPVYVEAKAQWTMPRQHRRNIDSLRG